MYNPQYTRAFYNACAEAEWERLERSAYGRLQAIIHTDFLQRYIKPGDRVLDAGSGPGRFSLVAAQNGAKVTVLDISDKQLALAREKITESRLSDNIEQFVEADIADLSRFPSGHFDKVICFGGALSYVCEMRLKAAQELLRITKKDGILLISVMSLMGSCLIHVGIPDLESLREPDKSSPARPAFWEILKTGDLSGFPSKHAKMQHAPMHLYTAEELRSLFKECRILELAGSNVTASEYSQSLEQISADPQAWATLVELERKINSNPGLVNCGTHIILVAQK
jgi:ubiquinone/menaquinone biosynthesis C-methylase UbiE